MNIKIGANPITWSNDDLQSLGKEISLDACLQEGKRAGYSGFELGHKFPREAQVLKNVLEKLDLSLVSGWFSGAVAEVSVKEEMKRIESHLSLLKALGSEVMVYCDVTGAIHCDKDMPLSKRPKLAEKQWEGFCERLSAVAKYCLSEGVRIAYHHHMGSIIQTEKEIDRLMQNTDEEVGLLLDTGHLTFAGGDPIKVFERYQNRICHVHCKDIRKPMLDDALNCDLSFLDSVLNGVFTVPGDGFIDYHSLFDLIKKFGYEGWLVVEAEQDPCVAPSFTYAKLGADFLHQQCADRNITVR